MLGLDTGQVVHLLILVAAFVAPSTERLRNDVVVMLAVVALAGTGLLDAREALAGVGSEPAIVRLPVLGPRARGRAPHRADRAHGDLDRPAAVE
jgi:hypothetical protein